MKNLIYMAIAALMILCGCQKKIETQPYKYTGEVTARLSLSAKDLVPVPRSATDENRIDDINLYFFSTDGTESYYGYYNNAEISMNILPGEYMLYIIANTNNRIGDLAETAIQNYSICWDNTDIIPMTANKAVSVYPVNNSRTVDIGTIELQRCSARIRYEIMISPLVAGMQLLSVQCCNVPLSISAFASGEVLSSTYPGDYHSLQSNTLSGTSGSGIIYMLENKQGVNSTIGYQMDKNKANSPECATYLNIKANDNGKIVDYFVYLGENNTSDFNIRRNTSHIVNIEIRGSNLIDTRIERDIVVTIHDVELSDIQLVCSGAYSINSTNKTYTVPYSSTCNFTATKTGTFLGWYEGSGNDAVLLTESPTLNINPTNDINLWPKFFSKKVNTINMSSERVGMSYKITLTTDYAVTTDIKIGADYMEDYRDFVDDRADQRYYNERTIVIKAGERSAFFYNPIDDYSTYYQRCFYFDGYVLLTPSDDTYIYQFGFPN